MRIFLTSVSLLIVSSVGLSAAAAPPPVASPAQQQAPSAPVDPQRLDLARRFLRLTQPIETTVALFTATAQRAAARMAPDDASEAELAAGTDRIGAFLTSLEPKVRAWVPVLQEADARSYARIYSAAELQQMVSFAESPAGRHYFAESMDSDPSDPDLIEAQTAMQVQLMIEVQRFQKQLCSERAAKQFAAGDKMAKCRMG